MWTPWQSTQVLIETSRGGHGYLPAPHTRQTRLCLSAKIPRGQVLYLPVHHWVPSLEPGTQVLDKWHTMIEGIMHQRCLRPSLWRCTACEFFKKLFLCWVASLVAQMVKNLPACNVGDVGLILLSGRFPWRRNSNLFQYSCLENSTGRGAWWATVHDVEKSWTRLSD